MFKEGGFLHCFTPTKISCVKQPAKTSYKQNFVKYHKQRFLNKISNISNTFEKKHNRSFNVIGIKQRDIDSFSLRFISMFRW